MILSYLYDLGELNKLSDGLVLSIKNYSFNMPKMYEKEEVLKLKNTLNNSIFIDIRRLYHEDELDELRELIEFLKDIDGFIFQDLSVLSILIDLNIASKGIYMPFTFNSTSYDKDFFNSVGLTNLVLSSDITKDDINKIIKNNKNYSYYAFGYLQMFYSARKHFTNYDKFYKTEFNLKNKFDVRLKEDTRDDFYHVLEDEKSFRIFQNKIFNAYNYFNFDDFKYTIIDRLFIEDEMYFDTIKLFKNEINKKDYFSKYKDAFTDGYLLKEVGLLKE